VETYKIIWTARAKKDLRKVYDFYCETINEEKSFEIVIAVLDRVELLSEDKFAKMGAIDEEFKHLKRKYRKLIENHIKITYRLSTSEPVVYINRVFDTRQHPSKNK
jgi:plasmid stabilization system protein ParE